MRPHQAHRLILTAPRRFTWEAVPQRPLRAGEVGVRTCLSAVSVSTELSVVEGHVPVGHPYKLGYQTLGRVEAVGPETTLEVGQRVVSMLGHSGYGIHLRHLQAGGRCCVLSDGNWGRLTLPPEFHSNELSVVASSDGEDYHVYAAWLWKNAEPVLESLFQETVAPGELLGSYRRLLAWPRPVSVLVDWRTS